MNYVLSFALIVLNMVNFGSGEEDKDREHAAWMTGRRPWFRASAARAPRE